MIVKAGTAASPRIRLLRFHQTGSSEGLVEAIHYRVSLVIGWMVKVLIVRFGGSGMFRASRPFFIGLILGELAAAGLWMAVSLALSAMDLPYQPVRLLPG